MQNKPNFRKAKMNVNSLITMDYEIFIPLAGYKNKPNSNPLRQACVVCEGVAGLNKPNLKIAKMNANDFITKDYRKKDDFSVRINKPNFRNGQNERKLTDNKGLQKKRLFSSPKNKPNSNPISPKGQNELKIPCRKIRPHPSRLGLPGNCCNLNEILILSDFKCAGVRIIHKNVESENSSKKERVKC